MILLCFWFNWVKFSFGFFPKTVQLVTAQLSMDRFRTFIYQFSSISVRFSSVQQFTAVFGFFAHP